MISYANGQWIKTSDVAFSAVEDAVGTIRGFRIFTACKTISGRIFKLQAHIDRLWESAQQLGMILPHTQQTLTTILDEAIQRNIDHPGERLIEIFYSGGPAASNGTSPIGPAFLVVLVLPLKSPADSWYTNGVSVATYAHQRQFPEIKLTSYVGAVVAHHTVCTQYGADLPLFISPDDGRVLEGSTFNFFAVRDGQVVTPALDGAILKGITRQTVIECAGSMGIDINQTVVPAVVAEWDEAFLTSSVRNIVPIVRVNAQPIGTGKPGPVTARLMAAFPEFTAKL